MRVPNIRKSWWWKTLTSRPTSMSFLTRIRRTKTLRWKSTASLQCKLKPICPFQQSTAVVRLSGRYFWRMVHESSSVQASRPPPFLPPGISAQTPKWQGPAPA